MKYRSICFSFACFSRRWVTIPPRGVEQALRRQARRVAATTTTDYVRVRCSSSSVAKRTRPRFLEHVWCVSVSRRPWKKFLIRTPYSSGLEAPRVRVHVLFRDDVRRLSSQVGSFDLRRLHVTWYAGVYTIFFIIFYYSVLLSEATRASTKAEYSAPEASYPATQAIIVEGRNSRAWGYCTW